MRSKSEAGEVSLLLISLILVVLCLFGAVGFGVWAYGSRQDYKDNVDQKINVAVASAKKQEDSQNAILNAEAEKYPLKSYTSPEADGSITIKYPKTWSAYVVEAGTNGNSQQPIDGYFQPNIVPDISNQSNNFALHVQLLSQSYSQSVSSFSSQLQQQQVTIRPYKPKNVTGVIGVRVDGQIDQNHRGSVVILPLRSDTLELSTEAVQYESDFNSIILANLRFSP